MDLSRINELGAYAKSDEFGLFAASEWHRLYTPYIPFDSGAMALMYVTFDPWVITHTAPYAHYQYEGEVYGANIPVTNGNGDIERYFSQADKKKHPTGRQITYQKDGHPKASAKWDEAAKSTQLPKLCRTLSKQLARKIK